MFRIGSVKIAPLADNATFEDVAYNPFSPIENNLFTVACDINGRPVIVVASLEENMVALIHLRKDCSKENALRMVRALREMHKGIRWVNWNGISNSLPNYVGSLKRVEYSYIAKDKVSNRIHAEYGMDLHELKIARCAKLEEEV